MRKSNMEEERNLFLHKLFHLQAWLSFLAPHSLVACLKYGRVRDSLFCPLEVLFGCFSLTVIFPFWFMWLHFFFLYFLFLYFKSFLIFSPINWFLMSSLTFLFSLFLSYFLLCYVTFGKKVFWKNFFLLIVKVKYSVFLSHMNFLCIWISCLSGSPSQALCEQ